MHFSEVLQDGKDDYFCISRGLPNKHTLEHFFFQATHITDISCNVNAHCHTKFPQTYFLVTAWNELNSELDLYLYSYKCQLQ